MQSGAKVLTEPRREQLLWGRARWDPDCEENLKGSFAELLELDGGWSLAREGEAPRAGSEGTTTCHESYVKNPTRSSCENLPKAFTLVSVRERKN